MSVFALEETDAILAVDIEPYGSVAGEMSTIYVLLDGEQIDWWPKLGPWHRSEDHAKEIAESY